jgi:hypothetical protein
VTLLLPAGVLRLSATITDVTRPAAGASGPVLLSYAQPSPAAPRTLACGALVNTVAQALPNLGFLSLDAQETALFASVFWCRYYSLAMQVTPAAPDVPKLANGLYVLPLPVDDGTRRRRPAAPPRAQRPPRRAGFFGVAEPLPPPPPDTRPAMPLLSAVVDPYPYRGEVTGFFTVNHGAANRPAGVPRSADPGLVVAYSYTDVPMTVPQVEAVALKQINGTRLRAVVRQTYEHIYYPRLNESETRGGWFARAEAMQGRRGTYHAGGLFTFWDVEHAMRSGLDIVQRFF